MFNPKTDMKNRFKKIFLLAGDIALFYLGLYLALAIRYWQLPSANIWQDHLPSFSVLLIIWLLVFYISNLYNFSVIAQTTKFIKTSIQDFLIAGLFSVIFFYLTSTANITPKTNLIIFAGVFLILFLGWRKLFSWSLSSYIPKTNLAVIGSNPEAEFLINQIRNKPHLGYKVSFLIDSHQKRQDINGVPVFDRIEKIPELTRKKKINTILLTHNINDLPGLYSTLFSCLPLKINFISLNNFFEELTGRVPIKAINQAWFLENLSEGSKDWFDKIKRVYDFILSILLLIITLPFYPLIALIIKLESSGPVFFRQVRSGQHGRSFQMIKFRTMTNKNNDHSPTTDGDKRITKFGGFLRKIRLDELPQIFNIFKGEMSFVGPRPERPEFIKDLEKQIPFYRERMLVKPGITGWDQISGEYHSPSYEDTLKKLQYDLFYIKSRSVYLDLSIVLKTISTMMGKLGK